MLVLSRKVGEVVVVAGTIRVTVVAVQGDRVRVGITAPANVPVDREEIHRRKELQRKDRRGAPGDLMPVPKKRYALSKQNVDRAPAAGGVYALFEGAELIFFGQALGGPETLRSCLQGHQAGGAANATTGATHYRRHRCADPAGKEKQLLAAYARVHQGRLPRCNAPVG